MNRPAFFVLRAVWRTTANIVVMSESGPQEPASFVKLVAGSVSRGQCQPCLRLLQYAAR